MEKDPINATSRRGFLQGTLTALAMGATGMVEVIAAPDAPDATEATDQTTPASVEAHLARIAGSQAARFSARTPETGQPEATPATDTRRHLLARVSAGVAAVGVSATVQSILGPIEPEPVKGSPALQFLKGFATRINS
jgi:hypothetical protein